MTWVRAACPPPCPQARRCRWPVRCDPSARTRAAGRQLVCKPCGRRHCAPSSTHRAPSRRRRPAARTAVVRRGASRRSSARHRPAVPLVRTAQPDAWHRAVAHLGTRVVQEQQDALMASAWDQAAQLAKVNQLLRQAQLGCRVAMSIHSRHISRWMPPSGCRCWPRTTRMIWAAGLLAGGPARRHGSRHLGIRHRASSPRPTTRRAQPAGTAGRSDTRPPAYDDCCESFSPQVLSRRQPTTGRVTLERVGSKDCPTGSHLLVGGHGCRGRDRSQRAVLRFRAARYAGAGQSAVAVPDPPPPFRRPCRVPFSSTVLPVPSGTGHPNLRSPPILPATSGAARPTPPAAAVDSAAADSFGSSPSRSSPGSYPTRRHGGASSHAQARFPSPSPRRWPAPRRP